MIGASESHASPFFSFQDMVKNPDPRVKWAMDIMDQEGEVCSHMKRRGLETESIIHPRSLLEWSAVHTSLSSSPPCLQSLTRQKML